MNSITLIFTQPAIQLTQWGVAGLWVGKCQLILKLAKINVIYTELCPVKTRQIWGILIAATGLVILLKLDSNHQLFSPCDLEIWWMTFLEKPLGMPSLLCQALCIVSNPLVNSNWSYSPETLNSGQKWRFFCLVWPWNLMDDLEKQ